MSRSYLLLTDALINLALGVVLVAFPKAVAEALGLPSMQTAFFPSILGAVLFGIGVALWIEWRPWRARTGGLGLAGAIAINLSGGLCLAGWLLLGSLGLTLRGNVVLWVLVVILVGISTAEWITQSNAEEASAT